MASEEAARRYAQAVLQIAVDDQTIDQWRQELADIAAVLADSELGPVLADDRIPVEDREKMIERVLDLSPKALNLAKLLVRRGRSRGARFVEHAYIRMADALQGRVQAEVTAAVELSPEQIGNIESRLSQELDKRVSVKANFDPGLIGGIIIRVGDQLTDGSVRTRLRRLHRQLEGAA